MEKIINLPPDFKEFVQSLNDKKVKYLLVGGYAVAYHGYTRFTKDIDFWIWAESKNVELVLDALKDFSGTNFGYTKDDFLKKDIIFQIGMPPNRIDLITSIDGITFEEAFPKKIITEIDGVEIAIIDLESLKKNKKSSGRTKDLLDFEELSKE